MFQAEGAARLWVEAAKGCLGPTDPGFAGLGEGGEIIRRAGRDASVHLRRHPFRRHCPWPAPSSCRATPVSWPPFSANCRTLYLGQNKEAAGLEASQAQAHLACLPLPLGEGPACCPRASCLCKPSSEDFSSLFQGTLPSGSSLSILSTPSCPSPGWSPLSRP